MTIRIPGFARRLRCALPVLAASLAWSALPAQAQVYWRVEAGSSHARDAGFQDKDFEQAGLIWDGNFPPVPGILDELGVSPLFGVGVGYRFDDSVRGDVVLGYRGRYALTGAFQESWSTRPTTYDVDVASTTLLVNGYYDFRPVAGVRPYLGAGIGVARNRTGQLTQDFGFGFTTTVAGATRHDFAFALMAGVGLPMQGWTLDVGYRYVDMGKFETGVGGTANSVPPFAFPFFGASGKLRAHEVVAGARF